MSETLCEVYPSCQEYHVSTTSPKIITQYPFKANKSEFVDLVVFLMVSMKISIFQIDRLWKKMFKFIMLVNLLPLWNLHVWFILWLKMTPLWSQINVFFKQWNAIVFRNFHSKYCTSLRLYTLGPRANSLRVQHLRILSSCRDMLFNADTLITTLMRSV